MGNITSDTRGAGPAMTFEYDVEGRLAHAYQTATPAEGGTYAYDSRWRLASRTVSHASPGSSTTILYLHDLDDHIIAETDISGNTLREYIWLGDTPLAVVDNVATSPAIFYVHTDHLMRPLLMTDASAALAWSVAYEPFGAVASVNAISSSIDLRFPGQWFQLESGLHYNWHRHYDASTGRYVQPDPLLVDDTQPATIGGRNADALNAAAKVGILNEVTGGQQATVGITHELPQVKQSGLNSLVRTMLRDGPSLYGFARQNPLSNVDRLGLATVGRNFTPIPGKSILQCVADDDVKHCTRLYEMCVMRYWTFAHGYQCDSCLRYCVVQGYWPFQYCSP